MTKGDLLMCAVCVIMAEFVFGGFAGLNIDGSYLGAAEITSMWSWSSAFGFVYGLLAFRVHGMPEWVSAILYLPLTMIAGVVVWTIRGN